MEITDLEQLAQKAQVPVSFLTDIVENRIDPYHEFGIMKRRGKALRVISAPSPQLAKVQRYLLDSLPPSPTLTAPSFAYHKGISIKHCASIHAPARWLVKLDLEDFFGSITAHRVTSTLRSKGLTNEFSSQLAAICTRQVPHRRRRSLPQGAPTSGMLANLAATELDKTLVAFARHLDLRYTRYADDLTFSSSGNFARSKALHIVRQVRSKVAAHGFSLNETKIRIRPPGSRLIVLGLLVDSSVPRLRNDFKHLLEWHVYGSDRFGIAEYSESRGFRSIEGYLRHVDGLFAHAVDVQPEWAVPIREKWNYVSDAPAGRLLGNPL